jgi:hypothetical protein
VKTPFALRTLIAVIGMTAGMLVGWYLPFAFVPHPHEFDGFLILSGRLILVPVGALIGFITGVGIGRHILRPMPTRLMTTCTKVNVVIPKIM